MSVIGYFTSKKLEANLIEEGKAERSMRSIAPSGFAMMATFLASNFVNLGIFLFAAIWFICYDKGPISTMTWESHQRQDMTLKKNSTVEDNEAKSSFTDNHIGFILVIVGIFCGYVSFLLVSTLQLSKKILRRMMRLNTMV